MHTTHSAPDIHQSNQIQINQYQWRKNYIIKSNPVQLNKLHWPKKLSIIKSIPNQSITSDEKIPVHHPIKSSPNQ
jgi:hypothetical protein